MPDQGCLILDDVSEALAVATELGRSVLSAPSAEVRTAVLDFARRRGWTVVRHSDFSEWLRAEHRKDGLAWVVLDPLFSGALQDPPHKVVRLTRQADGKIALHGDLFDGSFALGAGALGVGVADDAVSSGRTLRHLTQLVASAGTFARSIAVCASATMGRTAVLSGNRSVIWKDFIPGDWRAVHLRDGCPHLPFSARPTGVSVDDGQHDARIELRIQPTAIAGNLWQVLALDAATKRAIAEARHEVVRRLEVAVGRPPRVFDLSLLGTRVPALVMPGESVSADATLRSLIHNS